MKVVVLILFLAVPALVAGQLFPYDRPQGDLVLGDEDQLIARRISEHTRLFGSDTVTLEVYYEPMERLTPPGGYVYTLRCIETLFVSTNRVF